MKKLLSLLSVLTISGTAVPATIAASPYQKEETKLENNKIRIKRTIRNIDLNANFPNVKQLRNMWCGPAVVEAILRYFGLNPLLLNNIQGEDGYQSLLANRMQTSDTIGTFPNNLLSVINQAINERNLNNRRQYSITTLPSNYANHLQFYNLIRNSIENNVPVMLAHNGILPSTNNNNNNEDTPNNQHFIVIIGIIYNTEDPSSSTYRYMDPATGSVNSFRGYDLRNILNASNFNTDTNTINRSSSFLLSYINPTQTISLNINQTEMMECDYGLGRNSITLMSQNYCSNEHSRSIRSINNYSSTCLPISDENPYFDKNKDYFQVDYKTGHDKITVVLSLNTANAIKKFFIENNKSNFLSYLINLFKKINNVDNTGWGGSILHSDYATAAGFIYKHFPTFNEKLIILKNKNDNSKRMVLHVYRNSDINEYPENSDNDIDSE